MLFLEETVYLSSRCHLKCLGCKCWQQLKPIVKAMRSMLYNGTFYRQYKNAAIYNIVGGNPLLSANCFEICRFLKAEGKYLRLWASTDAEIERITSVRHFVDEFLFYFPCIDTDEFLIHTGEQKFSSALALFDELKLLSIAFSLHTFVRHELLTQLPDLVEFCLQRKISLLLHYNKHDFSKFDQKNIAYFSVHPSVKVISTSYYPKEPSCFVPVYDPWFGFKYRLAVWRSKMRRIIASIQL